MLILFAISEAMLTAMVSYYIHIYINKYWRKKNSWVHLIPVIAGLFAIAVLCRII